MVPSLPVFLLDVNSPLGNQFRSTRKQSRPLQGFLFHHLCWGLKNWGLLNFSILHTEPKPRKGKAICNKVLMVFKHRMQDTVATSLQLISAGCKGCTSCVCMQNQFQQKDLNCSVFYLVFPNALLIHPAYWEPLSGRKSFIKKEQIEGRPHKDRGLCWLWFTLPGSSSQSAWLRPSCWPRAGGGGTWFAGSLAGVAHQTPTGRQSPPPGQRTGTRAGSGAGPLRWWSTCSWRNWGSHTGTPGSQRCHWDPAVGRCSSGLGERKGAVHYGQKDSETLPEGWARSVRWSWSPFSRCPLSPQREGSAVTEPKCKLACAVPCPADKMSMAGLKPQDDSVR